MGSGNYLVLTCLIVWSVAAEAAQPIPACLFGQNLEHTRAALEGGLSAQLVRNRKFAGKPSRRGVAAGWRGYGERSVFDLLQKGFTRHAAASRMFRQNEISSQFVESLSVGEEVGVCQDGLPLRGGVAHTFRAAVRALPESEAKFVVRLRSETGGVIAERTFPVRASGDDEWRRISFGFTPATDSTAGLSIGVVGRACGVIGVVSLLPDDNFHGMRPDVVDSLKVIGTSIVRWPGGNFAGEYRWRDGYIEDRDERAPLQSYTEIETQTFSYGYDQNDISTDDVLALCAKIGAEPFFTINAVWDTPADSAEWVRRCQGKVRRWSLGNELGYVHMEGPQGPSGYVNLVRPHAEAMLKADPGIKLTSSGKYPFGGREWVDEACVPLADLAPCISYHTYTHAGCFDFTTPERTAQLYARLSDGADRFWKSLREFRAFVPQNVRLSVDEWNVWYPWYRDDGIAEGLFAAKMIHAFMREWERQGIECVCYFQPVNELAIDVGPFASRLTSIGEAMRLAKGHVGGVPAEAGFPDEVFMTDHAADGVRFATFYNFSTTEPRTFDVPTAVYTCIGDSETLVPNGLETGCRLARKPTDARVVGNRLVLSLSPASLAAVRLTRMKQ